MNYEGMLFLVKLAYFTLLGIVVTVIVWLIVDKVKEKIEYKQPEIKLPQELPVCEECKQVHIPPWLEDEIFSGLKYKQVRDDIIRVSNHDMHEECAQRLVEAYDTANNYLE